MPSTAPPVSLPEERVLVTVLITRLAGLPEVAEGLDREEAAALVLDLRGRMEAIVDAHAGYVIHTFADEVVALWGAPKPGKDDAERAVTCALALQEFLAAFQETSEVEGANEIVLKAAAQSGYALAVAEGERFTVLGRPAAEARELLARTEDGAVLIGHATYRLVRGAFRVFRREGLLSIPGEVAVHAYLVERRLEQPSRVRYGSAGGLETRMVGRGEQLADLLDLFEALEMTSDPYLVLVAGEAGMGKSRLLMEFSSQVESIHPDVNFITVRGALEGAHAPYYFWKTLWMNRFGIRADMENDAACEQFLRGILQVWGRRLGEFSAVEAAHLVGDMIGLNWKGSPYLQALADDPAERRRRAFRLSREILTRLSETGPVVLIVDDLQVLDPGSQELLRFLLLAGEDALPMFILASVQPDFFDRNLPWFQAAHRIIHLQPIGFTVDMVREAYPAVANFPDALIARMADRAAGNPYYMEEIVKSLLQVDGHVPQAPARPPSLAHPLPESLPALLEARLAAIPQEAREVLQLASITGRSFWVGGIKAAARQPVGTGVLNLPEEVLDEAVAQALQQVTRAELAFPRADSIFEGEQEYIFKHQLLQRAAYESLPGKYHKFYHFALAKWLSERAGPDFHGLIAGHFEKAGSISTAIRHYDFALAYARARGARSETEWLEARMRNLKQNDRVDSGGN